MHKKAKTSTFRCWMKPFWHPENSPIKESVRSNSDLKVGVGHFRRIFMILIIVYFYWHLIDNIYLQIAFIIGMLFIAIYQIPLSILLNVNLYGAIAFNPAAGLDRLYISSIVSSPCIIPALIHNQI